MQKAVLFDLDGTLFDTSPGIFHCLKLAMEQGGFPPLKPEQYRKFIGPPLADGFRQNTALSEEEILDAVRIFREFYGSDGYRHSRLYPGMEETLKALRGRQIPLAVCTLKQEQMAQDLLRHFHMDGYFATVKGQDLESRRQKKDIIELACRDLGIVPGDAVLVGDSPYDREGALQAGASFLGVAYGFGFSKQEIDALPQVPFARDCGEILTLLFQK